ncbi:MAG: L-threonylcarbamoyladenylate synthase [Firmicutes bacterium]|nr:L-threonylcarbamoyladenylate synthase [Bacillota bacterium]
MNRDTRIFGTTEEEIQQAAQLIRDGGLVAFPTETVYGLGADAMNAEAVSKVYEAKGRPSDNPMIVHIAERNQMNMLTNEITEDMKLLMDAFWPGPLTMVVQAKEQVPRVVTGGLDTVAVRMPDSKPTLELIRVSGCPLVGPSANLSGHPSPTSHLHVDDDLHGRIDAIIQGDNCRVGIESTVVDMTEEIPIVLRPGIITNDQIADVLNKPVEFDPAILRKPEIIDSGSLLETNSDYVPKSPGMKYKHYAPKAEMIIFMGDADKVRLAMAEEKMERMSYGQRVEVLVYDNEDPSKAAREFFAQLREFDKTGVDVIFATALDEKGVGLAVMNRMFKSAGYNIREIK